MNKKIGEIIKIRPRVVTIVFAMILSLFLLIGYSFSVDYSFDFLIGNDTMSRGAVVAICFRTVGIFIAASALFERIISVLFNIILNANNRGRKVKSWQLYFDRHTFLISVISLVLMWLPYYIVYFPGSVPADGLHMIKDAIGVTMLSNHHSWVLVLVFGFIFKVGNYISQNIGVFMVVCFCGIVEILCYSYVIVTIKRWGRSSVFCVIMLLFYGLMPGFGTFAQAFLKDGIFYSFFSAVVVLVFDIIRMKNTDVDNRFILKVLELAGACIVLSVIRRDAMVRIIVALIAMTICVPRKKKIYGAAVLLVTLHMFASIASLADSISVEQGRTREPLSIPFQQTARYMLEYPDDVTDEEYAAIDAVLDVDSIVERYDPELSDPVKEMYNENADSEQISAYIRAWLSLMKKHPRVYLEATLSNCFAYLYPFYQYDGMRTYQTYIKEDILFPDTLNYTYVMGDNVRARMDKYIGFWKNTPVLQLFVSGGAYTWLLLLCQCYLIYIGRKREAAALFIIGFNILILVGSPVNGLLRYTMVVTACLPQQLAWTAGTVSKGD